MGFITVLIISYVARVVILTLLLWIMIKLQKLNYNFPGLLGSAALASALDLIPYGGHYFAVPVLYLCIWKVTQASLMPDAVYTVVVAYALMFAAMFTLQMYVLFPQERSPAPVPQHFAARPLIPERALAPTLAPIDPAAAAMADDTNEATGTNSPSSKNADDWLKGVTIKGTTENGTKSMLLISVNKKTYELVTDEETTVQTTNGPCQMRLVNVSEPWAILEVNGDTAYLRLH